MYTFEKAKIKQMLGNDVYDMLKETKCVLAGGAIVSLFTHKEVADYDLYYTTQDGVDNIVSNVFGVCEDEWINQYDLISNHVTERSFLVKSKHTQAELQFIHYRVYPTVQDIFKSFDFEACMGAFDFASEEFIFHDNFFKDNASRTLTFNKNTDFPIVSALRVEKYREKGYKISKAQMLRVLFAVVNKDYNNWDTVISEIGGLYGIDPKELFDTEKPFSLDEVIDQLSLVNPLENRVYEIKENSFETVVNTMYNAFSDNFKNWYDGLNPNKNCWYTSKHQEADNNKYDSYHIYDMPDRAAIKEAWKQYTESKSSKNFF